MAVTDAYTDAATYRNRTGKTDTAQDAAILLGLTAISRAIDLRCERFFTQDASVVARVYTPSVYTDTLIVDDIAATAGLLIKVDSDRDGLFSDETAWASTDYELRPRNADKGSEPKPWTQIVIPPWSSKGSFMPGYPVEVTAKFGWPAIPQAIVEATIQIAGILRIESPRATTRIAESINKDIGESKEAKSIIEELVEAYARVGQQVFS
jgi:hypothetical protein